MEQRQPNKKANFFYEILIILLNQRYLRHIMTFYYLLIALIKKIDKKFNNKDIYLLVDDADNLPLVFTKTLNEWLLYRDIDNFSLKISTQLKYKTYMTISNNRIEKPHDYSEIIFSYVVSSEKKKNI